MVLAVELAEPGMTLLAIINWLSCVRWSQRQQHNKKMFYSYFNNFLIGIMKLMEREEQA